MNFNYLTKLLETVNELIYTNKSKFRSIRDTMFSRVQVVFIRFKYWFLSNRSKLV